jgi:hypothetical protein
VNPVPDPHLRKPGSVGIDPGTSGSVARNRQIESRGSNDILYGNSLKQTDFRDNQELSKL